MLWVHARSRVVGIDGTIAASGLFEAAVEVEAHAADEQIRHANHEVDALVVCARFPQGVVIVLRTGGHEGVLSVGTGVSSARRGERDRKGGEDE
jgi:hypothetical protein